MGTLNLKADIEKVSAWHQLSLPLHIYAKKETRLENRSRIEERPFEALLHIQEVHQQNKSGGLFPARNRCKPTMRQDLSWRQGQCPIVQLRSTVAQKQTAEPHHKR